MIEGFLDLAGGQRFLGLAAVVSGLIVLWLLRAYWRRKTDSAEFFDKPRENGGAIEKEEKKGVDADSEEKRELSKKEEELKSREDELKRKKHDELAQREAELLERELKEKSMRAAAASERSMALSSAFPGERVFTHDWIRPSGFPWAGGEGFFQESAAGFRARDGGVNALERERGRIRDMIEAASESYREGGLSESEFSRSVLDFQRQLIDVEIQLKGAGF